MPGYMHVITTGWIAQIKWKSSEVKCSHLNLRRIPGYPFLQLQTSEQKNISSESGANYPQNIRMELINNYAIRAEMKLKFNFLSQK